MNMKKTLKILGWTAGSIVVLAILLIVGLHLFLPAEKLRDLAVARASATLGREVAVREVRVSLRGGLGIRLAGVSIGNPAGFPGEHLLSAESVDLKLRLRPLLKRQVYADRLVIDTPVISLVKLDAERNNFTFTSAQSGEPTDTASSSESAGTTLDLDRLEINGGALDFRDEETGTGFALTGLQLGWTVSDAGGGRLDTRGETRVDSLKITGARAFAVGPATLNHTARIDRSLKRLTLEQGDLVVAGLDLAIAADITYDPQDAVARVEVTGEALDLATVLDLAPPDLAAALDGVEASGILVLHTTLALDRKLDDPLSVTGSLGLTGGRLVLPDVPEPVTGLNAAVTFGLDTLRVETCRARTAGADLAFSGTVSGLKQPAEAKIAGTIDAAADLAGLQGYLPAERKATLSGKAAGSIRLAGRLDSPRDLLAGGEFTVSDLSYRDANIFEPVTDLDAVVSFGTRDLTIKTCKVKLQPSNFTLSGVVRGLIPALTAGSATRPHLDFTLDAPLFNVDHLFPAASPGAAPLGAAAEATRSPVIQEFPDFTGAGTVTVANLIYGGVSFTGITGKVAIADRTVTVSEANGAVFAGRVTGQTAVDLKDMKIPGYRGSFAAQGIQADSLLSRFTPLKGHVLGALDFSGSYTATGKDPAAFQQSLAMDARGAMTQGRLITTGVIQQGLSTLATRLGRTFDKEEKLRDVAGTVKTADERVILDGLASEIPGLGALSLGGSYGFAGDLDFRGDLLLTEENSRKLLGSSGGGLTGAVGNLLGRKNEPVQRLKLPVKIGGAFTRPDVAIDFSALAKSAGQDVVDELKGKLEGLFRK